MVNLYETVSLFDDEEIVGFFRSHWVTILKSLVIPLLILWAFFFFMFGLFYLGLPGVIAFLVGVLTSALVIWRRIVMWYGTFYILTNRRLFAITRFGFFKKKVNELMLSKVATLSYDARGFRQTVFRLGTVIVAMRDGHENALPLENLPRPQLVMDSISRQVHALQAVVVPPPPPML